MDYPGFIQDLLKISFMMRACDNSTPRSKGKSAFWQPWVNTDDNSKQTSVNNKQLPTAKWKRDRRSRLPEYTRKSDPKIPEGFNPERQGSLSPEDGQAPNVGDACNGCTKGAAGDAPIDMSVRQRGLPPSYAQTVNNPSYRSNYRPSVIQNGVPFREEIPSGMSMCDPIIDEHFRRSLGNDYETLFTNNNVVKESPAKPVAKINSTNVVEFMDVTGMSVDDHFAKALGDTWLKLNQKEEHKNNSNETSLLSI